MFPKTRSQLRCFDLVVAGGARPSSQHSNFFCLSTWRRRARFLRQIALPEVWSVFVAFVAFCQSVRQDVQIVFETFARIGLHVEFVVLQPGLANSQELLKVWSSPRPSPSHFTALALGANPQHMECGLDGAGKWFLLKSCM